MDSPRHHPVIDLRRVGMTFAKPSGEPLPVLEKIDVRGTRGRNSRAARPVWVWKINAAAHRGRPYQADLGRGA